MRASSESGASPVEVPVGREHLAADLAVPGDPRGLVIFACHSGTGRFSARNLDVARALQRRGLATLAVDLLTPHEEVIARVDGCLRVNIDQLGDRLVAIIDWVRRHPMLRSLSLGLYRSEHGRHGRSRGGVGAAA